MMNSSVERINGLELKSQIQEKILAEFESHRDQFASYDEYLRHRFSASSPDTEFDAWWERVKQQTAEQYSTTVSV